MKFLNKIINWFHIHRFLFSTLFIFCAICLFCFTAYKNVKILKVPYFRTLYDNVYVNFEIPFYLVKRVAIGFDDDLKNIYWDNIPLNFEDNYYFYSFDFRSNAKNVYITINKKLFDKIIPQIKSVNLVVGKKFYYFDNEQIRNFEKSEITYKGTRIIRLKFPDYARKIQGAEHVGYNGNYHACVLVFLSFFYNIKLYILPWILFFIGLFIMPSAKWKAPPYLIGSIIFILALFLRFNMYSEYGFWWDELYTASIVGKPNLADFSEFFADPANPVMFALLSKFWTSAFGWNIEAMRVLPVILGSLGVLFLFALLKDRTNLKIASIGSFIFAISIFAISYSQEYRSYSLSMCLAPLEVYLLFKVLEKKTLDYYILFTVISIFLVNNHLFALVFIFLNFVYGCWYIVSKEYQIKKNLIKFFVSHILTALSFMPFVFITFWRDAVLTNYNDWIDKTDISVLYELVKTTFGSVSLLVFLVILCIFFLIFAYKFKNKGWYVDLSDKSKGFITYLIFLLTLFYVLTISFSFYRPIVVNNYYIIVYPFIISLFSSLVLLERKYKIITILLSFSLLYYSSCQTYNNSWKVARTANYMYDVAVQQLSIYKDAKVVVLLDPKTLGRIFYPMERLIWDENYNNVEKGSRLVTDIAKKYAKKKGKYIICVFWSELKDEDKKILYNEKKPYKYHVDTIKVPYSDHKVTRIMLNMDKK